MKRMLVLMMFLIVGCATVPDTSSPDTSSSSNGPWTIVYKVTGTCGNVSLTYENSSGGTSQISSATLPWTYTFTASGYTFLYVSAQNNNSSGTVTAEIDVNGSVYKTSTSSGAYVIATSSGTVGSY